MDGDASRWDVVREKEGLVGDSHRKSLLDGERERMVEADISSCGNVGRGSWVSQSR